MLPVNGRQGSILIPATGRVRRWHLPLTCRSNQPPALTPFFCVSRRFAKHVARCAPQAGRVAEWFKAAVLKTAVGSRPPWVRIPPRPPDSSKMCRFLLRFCDGAWYLPNVLPITCAEVLAAGERALMGA